MTIFPIPPYEIICWYYFTAETEQYKKRAIILAKTFPYKAIIYNGVQDLRWCTENEREARAIFERLIPFADDRNVLVLRLISTHRDFGAMTYKDVRQHYKGCMR
jgi:hypothetical protein